MDRVQSVSLAARAYFGANANVADALLDGGDPAVADPVHANVDAPFRPLTPFVPDAYWVELEDDQGASLAERLHLSLDAAAAATAKRWNKLIRSLRR